MSISNADNFELPNLAPGARMPGGVVTALPVPLARDFEVDRPVRPRDVRGRLVRRMLLGVDVLALTIAFLTQEIALGTIGLLDLGLLALSIPVWVLMAHGQSLYHLDSHRANYGVADEIGPVIQLATMWCWATLLGAWLIDASDITVDRVALFWALMIVLSMLLRSAVRAIAKRSSWFVQEALVIGPVSETGAILRKIARHPEWGIRAVAYTGITVGPNVTELRRRDDLEELLRSEDILALVEELGADRVMLAPALTEHPGRVELIAGLVDLGVHVDLIPSWSDVVGARLDLHELEGTPLLTIPRTGLRRSAMRLKRMTDICVASAALLVLAPLMLVCAVAIKLTSPGPVLFRQHRVGRDNAPFELMKFRSMCADAEQVKHTIAEQNYHGGGVHAGMFKIREDPRITRVGLLLRRFSLDELPQLLNILRGDMSLVGPRPLIANEDLQVEGRFRRRLGLTPGLTGLWQVNGRSDIPFEEMVSLDYLYVTNWSLWGDVKLLIRTLPSVLRGSGAY